MCMTALLQGLARSSPIATLSLPDGRRTLKHHQVRGEAVGIVELVKYLHAVFALMRAAEDGAWGVFYFDLNRALS